MTTEIFRVVVNGVVAIQTASEEHAQCAFDTVAANNGRVEMFAGIEAPGADPVDFQLVDSFEPEETAQPWGRSEIDAQEHAWDMAEAERA